MTVNRTHSRKDIPTAESIREALKLLQVFTEKKAPEGDDPAKDAAEDGNGLPTAETLKKIEDVLKGVSSFLNNGTKAKPASNDTDDDDIDDIDTDDIDTDEDDEDDDTDEDDEENNPFAGSYFWNPGPEWKTIGLVAGGAALVGLGVLVAKMLDD